MCWWGIYLVACGGSSGNNGGAYTVYSALFVTLLLRYVSGVAMLEKKQKQKAEFRVYMKETSAFFPWCAKVIPEGPEREKALEQAKKEIEEESQAIGGATQPLLD